jgi:hypothetical protein
MLTERDYPVLTALARFFVLTRQMIQVLCYLSDQDGRLTRRRLSVLCRDGYLKRLTLQLINPRDSVPSPIYVLGPRGPQFLAEYFADDRYLLKPTSVARPAQLLHYIAVAKTHALLRQAIEHSPVELVSWFHEEEVVNVDERNHKKHFKLFTELMKQPRLVCIPDAAFLLESDGHRVVCYSIVPSCEWKT